MASRSAGLIPFRNTTTIGGLYPIREGETSSFRELADNFSYIGGEETREPPLAGRRSRARQLP